MSKLRPAIKINSRRRYVTRPMIAALLLIIVWNVAGGFHSSAQSVSAPQTSIFRVGEKLSYDISFGKINNGGYAELDVVSRGKISGRDVVEIRSKLKTLDLVSAAFFLFDESRTVYAAPDTGLPLYVKTDSYDSVTPKESVRNYLTQPTSSFDFLTLIYKAREAGGTGTFPLFEGEQFYTATFQQVGTITSRTEVGNFDTTISMVQSDFLAAHGIKEMYVHFTTDEARVPVVFRFRSQKGEFKAVLSAIVQPTGETPAATPTPGPTPVPTVTVTPKPTPVPETYIENLPLAPELGFQIGESLEYRISTGGKPVAAVTLYARERKLFQKEDSLLLTATITGVEQGSNAFRLGDSARVQVDPDTLAPKWFESKFASAFAGLNQTVTFDRRTGSISFGGPQPVDAPMGTQTVLSLIYAMRSFNLKPSRDLNNPVNDTRVAVFWESKAYVFTLRPSKPEDIVLNGEKVSAQLITINTGNPGNPQLDALAIKVWLSTDERLPLRFSFGSYQADLISRTSNISK